MTQDDITRMARQAGFVGFDGENKCLREFATLVRAAEREACAKVCETLKVHPALNVWNGGPDWYKHGKDCAKAIRARGQDPMPLFDDWPQFACPPCNHNCNQGRNCPHKK